MSILAESQVAVARPVGGSDPEELLSTLDFEEEFGLIARAVRTNTDLQKILVGEFLHLDGSYRATQVQDAQLILNTSSAFKDLRTGMNQAIQTVLSSKNSAETRLAAARQQSQRAESRAEDAVSRLSALQLSQQSSRAEMEKAIEDADSIKDENMQLHVENARLRKNGGTTSELGSSCLLALWQLTAHGPLVAETLQSSPNLLDQLLAVIGEELFTEDGPQAPLPTPVEAAIGVLVNVSSRPEGRPVLMGSTTPTGESPLVCATALMRSQKITPIQLELVLALVSNLATDANHIEQIVSAGILEALVQLFGLAGHQKTANVDFASLDDIDVDMCEMSHAWGRVREKIMHTCATKILPALRQLPGHEGKVHVSLMKDIVRQVQSDPILRQTETAAALFEQYMETFPRQ